MPTDKKHLKGQAQFTTIQSTPVAQHWCVFPLVHSFQKNNSSQLPNWISDPSLHELSPASHTGSVRVLGRVNGELSTLCRSPSSTSGELPGAVLVYGASSSEINGPLVHGLLSGCTMESIGRFKLVSRTQESGTGDSESAICKREGLAWRGDSSREESSSGLCGLHGRSRPVLKQKLSALQTECCESSALYSSTDPCDRGAGAADTEGVMTVGCCWEPPLLQGSATLAAVVSLPVAACAVLRNSSSWKCEPKAKRQVKKQSWVEESWGQI